MSGPLKIEEVALLGIVKNYAGIRSEIAQEAVKVVDSPNFSYLMALYSLDSMLQRHYMMVNPIDRTYTLTPVGVSALYSGVERLNKLTQTFNALKGA
jgi:hypothetical protein